MPAGHGYAADLGSGTVLNCDGVDDHGGIRVMFSGAPPRGLFAAIGRASVASGIDHRASRLIPGILTDSVAFSQAGLDSVTFSRGSVRSLARVHSVRVLEPGVHVVYSKSEKSTAWNGKAILPHMVRYQKTNIGNIGFHGIPIHVSDGTAYQTEADLGQRLSGGCQRQANRDAEFVWAFADIGTTVVVI